MAHEITSTDKFAENRRNGDRAWHGLGDPIREGSDCQTAFTEHGLGWPTELAPIQALSKNGIINIPERYAHIRADNNQFLGLVSDGYVPFENQQLAQLADSLAGADKAVQIETCGTLYGGRQVFALVKLPHELRLGKTGQDKLDQYILVSNGHGGLFSTACYPTSIRVVCANTLRWSEKDCFKGIRFRHVGDVTMKAEQARLVLGTAMEESKRFGEAVMAMSTTHLTAGQIRFFMEQTFDKIFGKIDEKADAGFNDRLIEKKAKIIALWETNLANEKNTLDGIEGTVWSAYNAMSEYSDHQRGRFRPIGESKARVAANVFGVSHQEKAIAFRGALALVK